MSAATALSLPQEEGRACSLLTERVTFVAFFLADLLALLAAYGITIQIRGIAGGVPLWPQYLRLVPFLAVVPALIALMDLYPGVLLNPVEELRRLTIAIVSGMSLIMVATYLQKESVTYSRLVFVAAIPLGVALTVGARWLLRRLCCNASWWGIPTILLGPACETDAICRLVESQPAMGIRVVEVLHADQASLPSIGEESAERAATPYALVIIPSGADRNWVRSAERLLWGCKKIIVVPQAVGLLWSWMRIRHCGGMVGLEVQRELLLWRSRVTKRIMDFVLTVLGGTLVLPWVAIIAALVRLTSRGPAFYGQERIGEGGRTFCVWKFRTMVQNADELLEQHLQAHPELRKEWDADHKLKADPRVTRIGKLLRQTSLDELPQIWNVLLGDMSLVGPRPIVRAEAEKYGEEFDLYLKVRPGLTGLWQVSGRNNTTYDERVAMDVHYVRNWSVWLDVYLLSRTLGVVLRKQGAY